MEFTTCNQEHELAVMVNGSRVTDGPAHAHSPPTLLWSSRNKASAALGACPSESSVGLTMGGIGFVMSLQTWGPVLLSLQWVWLWKRVGSVMSLPSWGPVLLIFQWVLIVWGREICHVSHIVIVDREAMSLWWWPDVAVAPGMGKRRSFSC